MYLLWMKNNISVAKSPFLQEFQIHLSTSLHRKKFRCIKLTSKKLLKVELNISVTNFGLLEQKDTQITDTKTYELLKCCDAT